MLIIKLYSPTSWARIARLMDHTDDRKKDTTLWSQSLSIVDFIQNELGLHDLFSEDEIQKCIGIVNVNGIQSKIVLSKQGDEEHGIFEAGYFRCIYPTMALFSNSCECNCRCIHHGNFGKLIRLHK